MRGLFFILTIFATTVGAEVPDGFHPRTETVWNVNCVQDYNGCINLCSSLPVKEPGSCPETCQANLQTCQKNQGN